MKKKKKERKKIFKKIQETKIHAIPCFPLGSFAVHIGDHLIICRRAPSFVLNVIDRGYLLPFISFPEPAVFKNNSSSISHADFVEDAIRD